MSASFNAVRAREMDIRSLIRIESVVSIIYNYAKLYTTSQQKNGVYRRGLAASAIAETYPDQAIALNNNSLNRSESLSNRVLYLNTNSSIYDCIYFLDTL